MKTHPLISFITPFYERQDKLKEALESVLSSGFSDMEIILIDDASPLSSWRGHEELLEFIKTNKNIVYIREKENQGPGAARNRGMAAAKGDWLFLWTAMILFTAAYCRNLPLFLTRQATKTPI
jgi:CRISPR system Cascade subunit CasB